MDTNYIDNFLWSDWQSSIRDPHAPERVAGEQDLDRDAFLRLLTTQLQFQDPLNPMEDHAFVAQLAQFSALEQQQQTNLNIQRTQAFSMVGRDVVAEVVNEATNGIDVIGGRVESALLINGEPHVVITLPNGDGRQVALGDVRYVGDDLTSTLLSAINRTLVSSQNLSLVGQYAQFVDHEFNDDGTVSHILSFTEGRITSLRFDTEMGIMLTVDGREVTAGQVQEISDRPLVVGRPISGSTIATEGNPSVTVTNAIIERVTVNGTDGFVLETTQGRILLGDIDNLTAAFRTIGTLVTQGGYTGMAEGIRMSAGAPRLQLRQTDGSLVEVPFERATNASVLIGREVSFQHAASSYVGEVLRIERDEDYHNLIVRVGTGDNAEEVEVFIRNLDLLTQASNQVGRTINGQSIEGVFIRNGISYLHLYDGSTLLFTGQTTGDPIP